MQFFKLSGAGNDFVGFDNRDGALIAEVERPAWFARLCARGVGVGADGVLVLERSERAAVRMRHHNSDGGESEMCGNGLRCLARLAHHLGAAESPMTVETPAGVHRAEIVDDVQVRATLTDPKDIRTDVALPLKDRCFHATQVNTGVPHLVLDVDAWGPSATRRREPRVEFLGELNVDRIGPQLRHHPAVMPAGANVNFFARDGNGTIHMRTYERGVEAETMACGTGATAVAVALSVTEGRESPITVRTRSGEMLRVHFGREGDRFHDVRLEGPAVIIYVGELASGLMPGKG